MLTCDRKSQIAIEYCYRYRALDAQASVYWIHSSSVDRFEQAYRDISRRLALPQADETEVDHLQQVSDWFSDNGPWLLVVDNVDDLNAFFSKSDSLPKPLSAYLPQTSNGRILITTRDRRVGERLTGRTSCIQVLSPTATEAAQLLSSKLPDENYNLEACTALLERLEYLPLAITQAAAFMTENNVGLTDYMDVLATHDDLELIHFLNEDSGDVRRDYENSNSVIKTWKISFDQIRRQKRRAADVLSLMAVLDGQGVPKVLLQRKDERMTEFITATGTLHAFSLVAVEKDKMNFKMHHLVQLAMEQWLTLEGSLASTQWEALRSVENAYPNGNVETWQTCETLFPHAQIVIRYGLQDPVSRLTQAELLDKLAQYKREQGRFEQAQQIILSALKIKEELLEHDNYTTLWSHRFLGDLYRRTGHFDLAQKILREALTKFEALRVPGGIDALSTKMLLALSFDQENLQEVETMHREINTALERMESSETLFRLTNLYNLANNLRLQGRLKESEELHLQVFAGTLAILGPEHPSTLRSKLSLLAVYERADNEDSFREALQIQEKTLGPDHPETLITTINLSLRLVAWARLEEAEELALPALQKLERALGPKHPSTLKTIHDLGTIYLSLGRFASAKEFFERAVQGYIEVLGPTRRETLTAWWNYMALPAEWRQIDKRQTFDADHPVSITALDDRVRELCDHGQYIEAEVQARTAVAQHENVWGPRHKYYMWAVYILAQILEKLCRHDEAENLCRLALSVAQETLGADNDTYFDIVNSLGFTLASQGKLDEAKEQYNRVVAHYEESRRSDHPKNLTTRRNLALLLSKREQYEAAEVQLREVVAAAEGLQGFDNLDTLASVVSLATTLEMQEKNVEAEGLAMRAIAAYERFKVPDHPEMAKTQSLLAKMFLQQGRLNEAEEMCRKALKTQLVALGQDHPQTLISQGRLTHILRECPGKLDEARSMALMMAESCERVHGKEHPEPGIWV